jgi:hypothetical protein
MAALLPVVQIARQTPAFVAWEADTPPFCDQGILVNMQVSGYITWPLSTTDDLCVPVDRARSGYADVWVPTPPSGAMDAPTTFQRRRVVAARPRRSFWAKSDSGT